jgi:hypothetical protein
LVRELAGYDFARYAEITRWPLAEALVAYENKLREDARRDYHVEYLAWAVLAATGATKRKKPPEVPAILKE